MKRWDQHVQNRQLVQDFRRIYPSNVLTEFVSPPLQTNSTQKQKDENNIIQHVKMKHTNNTNQEVQLFLDRFEFSPILFHGIPNWKNDPQQLGRLVNLLLHMLSIVTDTSLLSGFKNKRQPHFASRAIWIRIVYAVETIAQLPWHTTKLRHREQDKPPTDVYVPVLLPNYRATKPDMSNMLFGWKTHLFVVQYPLLLAMTADMYYHHHRQQHFQGSLELVSADTDEQLRRHQGFNVMIGKKETCIKLINSCSSAMQKIFRLQPQGKRGIGAYDIVLDGPLLIQASVPYFVMNELKLHFYKAKDVVDIGEIDRRSDHQKQHCPQALAASILDKPDEVNNVQKYVVELVQNLGTGMNPALTRLNGWYQDGSFIVQNRPVFQLALAVRPFLNYWATRLKLETLGKRQWKNMEQICTVMGSHEIVNGHWFDGAANGDLTYNLCNLAGLLGKDKDQNSETKDALTGACIFVQNRLRGINVRNKHWNISLRGQTETLAAGNGYDLPNAIHQIMVRLPLRNDQVSQLGGLATKFHPGIISWSNSGSLETSTRVHRGIMSTHPMLKKFETKKNDINIIKPAHARTEYQDFTLPCARSIILADTGLHSGEDFTRRRDGKKVENIRHGFGTGSISGGGQVAALYQYYTMPKSLLKNHEFSVIRAKDELIYIREQTLVLANGSIYTHLMLYDPKATIEEDDKESAFAAPDIGKEQEQNLQEDTVFYIGLGTVQGDGESTVHTIGSLSSVRLDKHRWLLSDTYQPSTGSAEEKESIQKHTLNYHVPHQQGVETIVGLTGRFTRSRSIWNHDYSWGDRFHADGLQYNTVPDVLLPNKKETIDCHADKYGFYDPYAMVASNVHKLNDRYYSSKKDDNDDDEEEKNFNTVFRENAVHVWQTTFAVIVDEGDSHSPSSLPVWNENSSRCFSVGNYKLIRSPTHPWLGALLLVSEKIAYVSTDVVMAAIENINPSRCHLLTNRSVEKLKNIYFSRVIQKSENDEDEKEDNDEDPNFTTEKNMTNFIEVPPPVTVFEIPKTWLDSIFEPGYAMPSNCSLGRSMYTNEMVYVQREAQEKVSADTIPFRPIQITITNAIHKVPAE